MDVRLNVSYEQVYRSQKVCISGPRCIIFYSSSDMCYHISQYSTLLFLATMNKCTELSMNFRTHVYWTFFFLVLVGATTSQSIRHLFLTSCIFKCLCIYISYYNIYLIFVSENAQNHLKNQLN